MYIVRTGTSLRTTRVVRYTVSSARFELAVGPLNRGPNGGWAAIGGPNAQVLHRGGPQSLSVDMPVSAGGRGCLSILGI